MSTQDQPPGGRTLALDLGERRIGLAISDPLGLTAQGLPSLKRTSKREDFSALLRLIREMQVSRIVVGLPLHMSGREGSQAAAAREFARALAERTGLPVELWDERLTTVEAERVLRASGVSHRKRSEVIDRLSAVLILQSYLEAQAARREEQQDRSN